MTATAVREMYICWFLLVIYSPLCSFVLSSFDYHWDSLSVAVRGPCCSFVVLGGPLVVLPLKMLRNRCWWSLEGISARWKSSDGPSPNAADILMMMIRGDAGRCSVRVGAPFVALP